MASLTELGLGEKEGGRGQVGGGGSIGQLLVRMASLTELGLGGKEGGWGRRTAHTNGFTH